MCVCVCMYVCNVCSDRDCLLLYEKMITNRMVPDKIGKMVWYQLISPE